MATIVERAANGQRKAMEYLYQKNKKKIFYVAQNLLLDEKMAANAAVWVFENLWSASFALKMTAEEEFTKEAVLMTVEYCRKKIVKQNAKAFKTPPNKNFLITDPGVYHDSETYEDFILRQFSDLQRFIFVLHTVCQYDDIQIVKTLKIPANILSAALDAERRNVEKLLAAGERAPSTYEMFIDSFLKGEDAAAIPKKVDEQASSVMDQIAKPAEQKKKIMTMIASITSVVCLCAVVGLAFMFGPGKKGNAAVNGSESAGEGCYADIDIKDQGVITVKLDREAAPITTENFINLAKSGFYDGLTFHRIMDGFMMQGGDPEGTGMGGSKDTIVGEFSKNGYDNPLSHTRGAISMARSNDYDSASSQFFIVHQDSKFLDGEYAVFGYVTEGMDIVDKICESAEPTDDNGTIPADKQPVITSIIIRTE